MPKLIIDLDVWELPASLARRLKVPKAHVYNWIARDLIEFRRYPDLNLIIVRKDTQKPL